MHERESLNPYAAPKAQLDVTGAVPLRRPASVKWATFVMGLFTVVLGILYWQAIEEQGFEAIWKQLTPFDRALLLPLGLGLGLFGGRRKVSYYGIAAILAIIVIQSVLLLFVQWSASGAFERPFLGQRFVEALISYALGSLFYRFTIGLPSRRYFGVHLPPQSQAP